MLGDALAIESIQGVSFDAQSTQFTPGRDIQCLETAITGTDDLPGECDPS